MNYEFSNDSFRISKGKFSQILRMTLKHPANLQKTCENSGFLTGIWMISPYYLLHLKRSRPDSLANKNSLLEFLNTVLMVKNSKFNWCFIWRHYLLRHYNFFNDKYDKLKAHRVLFSTVCIKWFHISSCYVKCLKQWTYTEQNAACLMLTNISFKNIK